MEDDSKVTKYFKTKNTHKKGGEVRQDTIMEDDSKITKYFKTKKKRKKKGRDKTRKIIYIQRGKKDSSLSSRLSPHIFLLSFAVTSF